MKRIISFVILTAVILTLSIGLSGCKSESDIFIGKWDYPEEGRSLEIFSNGKLVLNATIDSSKTVVIQNATGSWSKTEDGIFVELEIYGETFYTSAKIKEWDGKKCLYLDVEPLEPLGFNDGTGPNTTSINFTRKDGKTIPA